MVVKEAAGGFLVVVEPWRLVVILWRAVILWRRRLRMKLQGCVDVVSTTGTVAAPGVGCCRRCGC
jgi:hypothetical protein